jgi:hypothetical protein
MQCFVSHCSSSLIAAWYGGADQWDVQATMQRANESLIARGYVTWFDLTNLKGEDVVFSL